MCEWCIEIIYDGIGLGWVDSLCNYDDVWFSISGKEIQINEKKLLVGIIYNTTVYKLWVATYNHFYCFGKKQNISEPMCTSCRGQDLYYIVSR